MGLRAVRLQAPILGVVAPSRDGQVFKKQLLTPIGQLEAYEVNIEPPFDGWKILGKPEGVMDLSTDARTYLTELNTGYWDLSVFNNIDEVYRLERELQAITSTPDLQHLIVSFNNAHSGRELKPMYQPQVRYSNGEVAGGDLRYPSVAHFIADKLLKLSTRLENSGRKLSVVHLEDYFYHNTSLNKPGLCHKVVEHAYASAINSGLSKKVSNGAYDSPKKGPPTRLKIFPGQEEIFLDYS